MRIILISAVVAFLPFLALSEGAAQGDPTSALIRSVEAGIVCPPEPIGASPAPGTLAGTTHIIEEEPPFVSTSRRVPAALGIGFGIKALSADTNGLSDVVMVVTHPPMGENGVQSQNFYTTISGLDPSLTFYQFDFDYELVPGKWEMSAFHKGELLYQIAFEVVAPYLVPELASACGYEQLLS